MRPLARRERAALVLWLVIGLVVWNGLYDEVLARRTDRYLFLQAQHQAGAGPAVDLTNAMEVAVRDACWIATLWAGLLVTAGLVTIRWR